jgi:uncharacterized membrane protein YhaH (DUF805 family)
MKELYVETKDFLSEKGFSERLNYTTVYLGWWWALWLIIGFISSFIFRFTLRNAETVDDYIVLTVGQMISNVLAIPLALITVKVIKDYSKVEPLLFQTSEENQTEEESDSDNDNNSCFSNTLQ